VGNIILVGIDDQVQPAISVDILKGKAAVFNSIKVNAMQRRSFGKKLGLRVGNTQQEKQQEEPTAILLGKESVKKQWETAQNWVRIL